MESKSKRRISNGEKVDLAKLRYSINPETQSFNTLSDVAKAVGRDPAVVSRAILSAFRDGLVEVKKLETSIESVRLNEILASRLRTELSLLVSEPNVGGFRVVDCQDTSVANRESDLARAIVGDRTHEQLGISLANDLSNGLIIPANNKSIGFSGGRAVYRTIDALRRHPPLQWRNTTLVSLSGHVHATDHSAQINGLLDADLHVAYFGICIAGTGRGREGVGATDENVRQKLTDHDITSGDIEAGIGHALESSYISPKTWHSHCPDFAVVGVGSLSPGHRFFDAAKSKKIPPVFRPIMTDLRKLVAYCEKYKGRDKWSEYVCVGDVANRLFFIPPPTGEIQDESDIKNLIERINVRLFNISLQQFSKIENVIVVAGTKQKSGAILELIENRDGRPSKLSVQILYIDDAAAQGMLNLISNRNT